MVFSQIFLYPDLVTFPQEFTSSFRDRTRYVCNFIGREISAAKFQTPGFKRLCIVGSQNPSPACFQIDSALSVEIGLDREEYDRLSKEELPEYFLALLNAGFEKTSRQFALPLEQIDQAISKFRALNYKNAWTHVEKTFRMERLKCKLSCELTMDRFSLTLNVNKNGSTILHQEVLTTPPDEVSFHHRFKELKFVDGKVVVQDKYGRLVFAFDPQNLECTNPPPN